MKRDYLPLLLIPALAAAAFPLVGSWSSWVTLSVAGLAMGLMIFIMASGLTLTFGLMDVLNFGHGAFIAVGAFVAASVMLALGSWMGSDMLSLNLAAIGLAVVAAMVVSGGLGFAFERVIVRPVYGQHLKQILVTTGGLIVAEQLLKLIWGPDQITLTRPAALRGAILFGDVAIERYRLLAVAVGLVVYAVLATTLNRTRIGLLIRAGVENGEMVEALGYRIRRLFIGVFVVGSALAGLFGRRLLRRCAAGGAHRQLYRLPRAQGRARLEHPVDGDDPAVAAAGPLSRGEEVESCCAHSSPTICRRAAGWRSCWS
jgi:branched-chain amino acid transport system permease protein